VQLTIDIHDDLSGPSYRQGVGTSGGYRPLRAIAACALLTVGVVSNTAHAATQVGTIKVVTLKPLSIVKISDLEFGTMIAGTAAGTVVIDPTTDARTTTGGTTAAGGTPKAAQFLTYGTQNSILQVTRGPLPVLSRAGGGATMNVTQLTLNGPVTRVVNPAGVLDLRVGGTLAVAANQLAGTYSGNFDITVTYF
jgi:hypothetical protein